MQPSCEDSSHVSSANSAPQQRQECYKHGLVRLTSGLARVEAKTATASADETETAEIAGCSSHHIRRNRLRLCTALRGRCIFDVHDTVQY